MYFRFHDKNPGAIVQLEGGAARASFWIFEKCPLLRDFTLKMLILQFTIANEQYEVCHVRTKQSFWTDETWGHVLRVSTTENRNI